MSWIELLEAKRTALYSTVVIVESNDDKRVKEYITALDKKNAKLWIWDTYAGLFRHDKDRQPQDSPIKDETGTGGMFSGGEMFATPVAQINKMLINETDEDNVVVIKNVLCREDMPMKALNYWATDDIIFRSNKTVVVFVPGRDVILPGVLEKCILVTPPLSVPDERFALLSRLLETFKLTLERPQIDELVALTGGLDLNQTEAVFIETISNLRATGVIDTQLVAKTKAETISKSSILRVLSNVVLGFERVGGYDAVKDYIREGIIAPLKDSQRAIEMGVEMPRGVILFGPPGTGKTIIAKAIAYELSLPFVFLNPENFMSALVGESERNLAKAIQIIENMAPCIVFIDEIDRFGGRRMSTEIDGGTTQRTFSQALEWLGDDKRKSIVIGATNLPALDEAFRREGRFDVMVPMLSPDEPARREILNVHLNVVRKVKHTISKGKLDEIAKTTAGWKGNMLEELIKRASRFAFTRGANKVSDKDLQDAYEDYQPNKTALLSSEEEYIKMAMAFCNSKRFLKKLIAVVETPGGETAGGREAYLKKMGISI